MTNIKTYSEHSINPSLLNNGICIDVGCYGFGFSKDMRDLGLRVFAFDIQDLTSEAPEDISFTRAAVYNRGGIVTYKITDDKQATFVHHDGSEVVQALTLDDIYETTGYEVDVLKLDCEGSEYLILSDPSFKPVATQLTVEFHAHAHPELHNQYYEAVMKNISRYYDIVKHDFYPAHGAGVNAWDSLFILK